MKPITQNGDTAYNAARSYGKGNIRKDLSPLRGGRGDSSPRPCQEGLPTIGAPHR